MLGPSNRSALSVSVNTVKSHLRHIYSRTETAVQVSLVAKLACSLAALRFERKRASDRSCGSAAPPARPKVKRKRGEAPR